MSDSIVFFHNPLSRGRVVHWMLEEIGAPYEIKLLDFSKADHKKPDYLALNPMGKIPAIVHRGVVVTEAAAIVTYLADAFPAADLAPATTDGQRGTYLRWLFFAAGCVEPAMVDKMLGRAPASRASSIGYGTLENTLDTLQSALEPGPFVLGEKFSAADICLASQIGWGLRANGIEPRPSFVAYAGRAAARPAYQRAAAQSEELIARLKS
jgi:glutathione S-transferase